MLRELAFAAAFLVAAIGGAANFWGHERSYYAGVVTSLRLDRAAFHFPGGDRAVPLSAIFAVDDETRRFVLDAAPIGALMREFFDANELAHLEDVRRVFGGVLTAAIAASVIAILAGVGLAPRRIRRAMLVDAAIVVVVGAVAAVAFEPLFLAFHELFFPQGNFLFDPATSNIVRLYPDWYWEGITLRVGASFVVVALAVAAFAHLRLVRRLA